MNLWDRIRDWFRRPPALPPGRPGYSQGLALAIAAARSRAGVAPLREDWALDVIAENHALIMQRLQRLAHEGVGDGTLYTRLSGQTYTSAGEVIALNGGGAEAVVVGWLASPPHGAILLGDWTRFGVGRAVDYWCGVFVR